MEKYNNKFFKKLKKENEALHKRKLKEFKNFSPFWYYIFRPTKILLSEVLLK